jgi:16S rRNA (guanine966-N2)-methyltransferase
MIRVTGGKFKNNYLDVPEDISRPLTDRIRLSLFAILMPYIENTEILDLYAGSGVTGIEALSRGAKHCTFVDNSYEAAILIRNNVRKIGIENQTIIDISSAESYIKKTEKNFDIIFLDPPFNDKKNIEIDVLSKFCHEDSIVVCRTSSDIFKREKHRIISEKFDEVYSKKYGQSQVVFYRPKL